MNYQSICHSDHAGRLIGFLQKKLAPLLFRIKPACLLGLSYFEVYRQTSQCMLWSSYKCQVMNALGVTYKEMGSKQNAQHILFYRREMLHRLLKDAKNRAFLSKQGYGSCNTVEDYVDLLAARFKSKTVPHEIGLFLGYPLHDVEQFIAGKSKPLFPQGRWLVYANPRQAVKTMELQKKAEEVMEKLITDRKQPEKYIERLSMHFAKRALSIQAAGG